MGIASVGAAAAGASPGSAAGMAPPGAVPPLPAREGASGGGQQRGNALTVIAGVGVLLLAMGVGVLIGRAGEPKQRSAPAEVITVGSSAPATGAASTGEEAFTDDWPAGTKGYTVQLEELSEASNTPKSVEQAKTAASSKGASSVGALKSEDFSSLTAGSYIVYSGDYHKRSEAQKALNGLKQKFVTAKVIEVSNAGSSQQGAGGSSKSGASSSGVGSSESHPAPPSVLESEKSAKGKSYEEKSKSLPNVVSTG